MPLLFKAKNTLSLYLVVLHIQSSGLFSFLCLHLTAQVHIMMKYCSNHSRPTLGWYSYTADCQALQLQQQGCKRGCMKALELHKDLLVCTLAPSILILTAYGSGWHALWHCLTLPDGAVPWKLESHGLQQWHISPMVCPLFFSFLVCQPFQQKQSIVEKHCVCFASVCMKRQQIHSDN